ncbi:MAG: glycosyltransferase family 2 protein [Planctomycetia bacterium]|nr:glycosyltransferase family 2 protein [Planctomycetia bacterium]
MAHISVIIPFYNEGENIERIYRELADVRASLPDHRFEILLMDNHSTDDSFDRAVKLAGQDSDVKVLRLSRNFGYQANILTGYLNSHGDVAIQLDADGEDDPRLIPEMLERWRAGYKVVYGVRRKRVESRFLQFQRKLFYRVLNVISAIPIPLDAGDFRLLDRQVIECLRQFREANPYLRGLIAYAGFSQTGIVYDRRPRYRGVSKFSWFQYWRLAWDATTSFSHEPLNVATYLGIALSLVSFTGALGYLIFHFAHGTRAPGFTTLIFSIFFLAGIQLICIGVIGVYVGRIFEEVKSRPKSFVETAYPPAPPAAGPPATAEHV